MDVDCKNNIGGVFMFWQMGPVARVWIAGGIACVIASILFIGIVGYLQYKNR